MSGAVIQLERRWPLAATVAACVSTVAAVAAVALVAT
jgi:hypothetical protein